MRVGSMPGITWPVAASQPRLVKFTLSANAQATRSFLTGTCTSGCP